MTIETMFYITALAQWEKYGLTKNVKMLMMICNTLKRARDEKSIENFLRKDDLINDEKWY